MKSRFKLLICSLLITILSLSSSMAFAMFETDLTSPEAVNKQLETNIFLLEKDLEKRGTTVETELENLISLFEKQKQGATESVEIAKLEKLINTTNSLITNYTNYKSGFTTQTFHPVYSPAIAAVVSWFGVQDYMLSAELLLPCRGR